MNNLICKDDKQLELKKHINTIHCSNNLTLVQRKLFNALLFNAYHELPYKQKFQIKSKDLCSLIGYNSKDTVKLKQSLLKLITIAIEWNVLDCSTGQEKKWQASSILASVELSGGVCAYEYSQVMRDFLYQPDMYGKINMELMSRFKSSYGLALYENCIRYQGLAQTPWFPLDIFRKLMGVFEDKYSIFKEFKKRVIVIAVAEVNNISSIIVTPEVERINQKVVKIRFKLEKKKINQDEAVIKSILSNDLNTTLMSIFGISQQLIEKLTEKYDQKYIQEKIDLILNSDSFKSGKIKGLAGYLIEALDKDYRIARSSKAIIEEQRKLRDEKEKNENIKKEQRVGQYENYVAKKTDTYLSKLTKTQYDNLISEFENHLQEVKKGIVQNWYQKYGLKHPATRGCFNVFVRDNKKEQLGEILSMEDFISLIEENS